MVAHARGAVLELAHPLVDQRDEVLHRVGNRRVGGEAGVARIDAAQGRALGEAALRLVETLGDRDLLGEDFNLFLDARTPVIERVDEFLEVEQPERQFELRGADDVGARTEAAAVLVVPSSRKTRRSAEAEDLADQHRDAARLPTPVEPRMAKCLLSRWSTSTVA